MWYLIQANKAMIKDIGIENIIPNPTKIKNYISYDIPKSNIPYKHTVTPNT